MGSMSNWQAIFIPEAKRWGGGQRVRFIKASPEGKAFTGQIIPPVPIGEFFFFLISLLMFLFSFFSVRVELWLDDASPVREVQSWLQLFMVKSMQLVCRDAGSPTCVLSSFLFFNWFSLFHNRSLFFMHRKIRSANESVLSDSFAVCLLNIFLSALKAEICVLIWLSDLKWTGTFCNYDSRMG